jgi:SAD/SRA domain
MLCVVRQTGNRTLEGRTSVVSTTGSTLTGPRDTGVVAENNGSDGCCYQPRVRRHPRLPSRQHINDRVDLARSGVHPPRMKGISGSQNEGADSIVVSGGYEDDHDLGDVIIYTGEGGRDPNTGKTRRRLSAQSWGQEPTIHTAWPPTMASHASPNSVGSSTVAAAPSGTRHSVRTPPSGTCSMATASAG